MLRQLTVENIALIDRLDLELAPGLTVITGETGAGKSILIDALTLALGERADVGLIRAGCHQAMVSARFQPVADHPVWAWLRERDLDRGEGELLVRRVLSTQGRNRALINEIPVPVTVLREAGLLLVDLHGQHEHQSLMDPATHAAILDAFAGNDSLVREVRESWERWRDLGRKREELEGRLRQIADRRNFLRYQLEELVAAAVHPGEWAEIESRRSRLAHAARLAQGVGGALAWLVEGEPSAIDLLDRVLREVDSLAALDPTLGGIGETLAASRHEVADVADRLRHYLDRLEEDPAELAELAERMEVIRGLSRKHHVAPDALAALAATWEEELDTLEEADSSLGRLRSAQAAERACWLEVAQRLSDSRRQAGERLVGRVEAELRDLVMVHTRLGVVLTDRGDEPRATGRDEVVFQVSANPGMPLQPLRAVASGGELSRLMLALKVVLTDAVSVSTLVFDEVDVGVGGRAADAIGGKLARAAVSRQVLAITHLPQVAAWGESHWRVSKQLEEGCTLVRVVSLLQLQREEELARMLAGEEITSAALANARALLRSASSNRGR